MNAHSCLWLKFTKQNETDDSFPGEGFTLAIILTYFYNFGTDIY